MRDKDPDDIGDQLNKYLRDAHAIESQAEQMLTKAIEIGGDPKLSRDYEEHLEQTRRHKALIEERLGARGASSNFLKDAAMKLGAINWGTFFATQPDTPAKLAGFAYAFEHLEIASYEQSAASPIGLVTSRWPASPRRSSPRSVTRRRRSGTASTGRSTHRSRASV